MKTKHVFFSILAVLLVFPFGTFAQQAPSSISIQVITTFDYPGEGVQTLPQGINDRGDITGITIDSSGVYRGFVRSASGDFSPPIVEPNDTTGHTEARGITDRRLICGWYIGSNDLAHGFFLNRGVFTEFDVAGANETIVDSLNDVGDFVGNYTSDTVLAAAFSNIEGTTNTIAIPGDAGYSFAYAINRSRQITGGYFNGIIHGWWQDSDGTVYAPFDPPGSRQTLPFGINDKGLVVGRFFQKGSGRGFLYKLSTGQFVIFDFPGAVFTSFAGINNDGVICGRYNDGSGLFHGFLAQVVTGP